MQMANILRLSSDRYQKLQADRRKEALYASQRQAISNALSGRGYRLYKLNNRPIFELNDSRKTRIYYGDDLWQCETPKIQRLIDKAIANL